MRKNYLFTTLAASVVLLAFVAFSKADAKPGSRHFSANIRTAWQGKENPADKLGPDLELLSKEYSTFLINRKKNGRTIFKPSNVLLQIQNGYVVIEAVAEKDPAVLAADLKAIGIKDFSVFGRMVSGLLPITAIDKMATLSSMRFAQPAYKPVTNAGFVQSQGDSAQRSNIARQKFGVKGKGTTIGVLSDSYNNLVGARVGVLSGDLPGRENPEGDTAAVKVLADLEGGGSDEGRAMIEIIHDVAPAAKLAFHTAFRGQADFANGIIRLRRAGADVITDDVFYFAEPFFQDGIIAQAVDIVKADGASYFSSAGNSGRDSYESAFRASDTSYFSGIAHNFAPGDQMQKIFIPIGATFIASFQWDDPYFSVSGGKGAATDMNIILFDRKNNPIAGGIRKNIGLDPVEVIGYENLGPDTLFNIVIEKVSGPDPKRMKYVSFQGAAAILEHATNSSTVTGHANAAGAIAVGAARYDRTPAFGRAQPLIEGFSSAGGTPILFDTAGNRITPIIRKKPEIVAPQGANTTFFIQGLDYEGDGFPNFFGTSASAPHAAGVASLMLEASDMEITPDSILARLESTAIDMDDPLTPGFDKGFDFRTGYGLIQADAAVEKTVKAKPTVLSFTLINADNGTDLTEIKDSARIDLSSLPTRNLNIRANTAPDSVGSVLFTLNGIKAVENFPPYAFAGDNGPGKYKAINPPLLPGQYTLTATPYSRARGEGKKGNERTVTFFLTDGVIATRTDKPQLYTYPNPITDRSTVAFTLTKPGYTSVEILDLRGNVVVRLHNQQSEAMKQYRCDLNSADLRGGMYLVKLTTGSEVVYQRVYVSK